MLYLLEWTFLLNAGIIQELAPGLLRIFDLFAEVFQSVRRMVLAGVGLVLAQAPLRRAGYLEAVETDCYRKGGSG